MQNDVSQAPTSGSPSEGGPTATEICGSLLRAAQLIRHLTAEQRACFGLNDARWSVLELLREYAQDSVGCSQAELATGLLLSESNICSLVERMRQDGLLYRMRSKQDRRKRLLKLTDAGRTTFEAAARAYEQRTEVLLATLTLEQRRELDGLLRSLLSQLEPAISAQRETVTREPLQAMPAPHFRPHTAASQGLVVANSEVAPTAKTSHQAGMRTDANSETR